MDISTIIGTLTLAGLALLGVSLWTARVALTAQRRRLAAAAMAATEATVFVVAFSRVLSDLDSPVRVAAYAMGVAGGTALALVLDEMVNPQVVKVDIVDPTGRDQLVRALHDRGWPTTVSTGRGPNGPVTVISVTTASSSVVPLTATVAQTAPEAFWTVSPVQRVHGIPVPPGFAQAAVTRRVSPVERQHDDRGTSVTTTTVPTPGRAGEPGCNGPGRARRSRPLPWPTRRRPSSEPAGDAADRGVAYASGASAATMAVIKPSIE